MNKAFLPSGKPWLESAEVHQTSWAGAIEALSGCLEQLRVTDAQGREITSDTAFQIWQAIAEEVRAAGGTVYLVGNGASASMASHFATDLSKNARIRAQVFTDLSQVTAIGNDVSFDQIYAIPLKRNARSGDMLVAISSSGTSSNILAAVEAAHSCNVHVVTLSAFAADNPLRSRGVLNFYIPAARYGLAETSHAGILHHWMDSLEA